MIFPITGVFTKILLLKTYQMRSLLIDWLLGNNYLRKRFCYFIFMSRQVIRLFFHKLLSIKVPCFNVIILNVYLHFCKSVFCGRVAKKES